MRLEGYFFFLLLLSTVLECKKEMRVRFLVDGKQLIAARRHLEK